MSQYTPVSGVVTNISADSPERSGSFSCALTLTVQDAYGNEQHIVVQPYTYVLNQTPVRPGDVIIAFYDRTAPMPLIYPPRFQAAALVKPAYGQSAALDVFDRNLINSDNTLRLELSNFTEIRTQNGQIFNNMLGGQLMLVLFGATTRSIPAQTIAESVTVFCG